MTQKKDVKDRKKSPLLTKEGLGVIGERSISDTWDFQDDISYSEKAIAGINETVVRQISASNNEPEWMLELRLKALKIYQDKSMPNWGPDISDLDLESIYYFAKPEGAGDNKTWDEVPESIKNTFDKLGIPEAEKKVLAGVGAQYDSETVYHSLKQELSDQGVIFDDMSHALKKYPDLVKQYFSKCIPLADHKFAALHYAVWSGGTFLYVPAGVKISEPLQSYFRMNVKSGGQFEHTLMIIEDGAEAHYIEGCSAPKYDTNSLHAGGVEIFVGEGAHMRYSSVENWSLDTYNLNTKRAIVEKNAYMEWVGGNMGSNTTMLYPCSVLKGDHSKADHLGLAFANTGQNQDTGAKVIHIGKNTSSNILSKSLSKGGGISTYRGLVDIKPGATGSVSKIDCDALLLDSDSASDTIPDIRVGNADSIVGHEASAGKVDEAHIFYLTSRGIPEDQAKAMIVNGFLSPIMKELPLEYASEMNVLVSMEMEGGF
ncbi:Fe-S cluster assembly protein SufB [Candidatus Gracilibacteria bacterium]|nr:Fe-S cluster assembly protein SufB [Candidatus Gracilibacteria bacterium]